MQKTITIQEMEKFKQMVGRDKILPSKAKQAPTAQEVETKLLSGKEKQEIQYLRLCWQSVRDVQGNIKLADRIKGVKNGMRRLRQAEGIVNSLLEDVERTIPQKQRMDLEHFRRHGIVQVKLNPISKEQEYAHLPVEDVKALLQTAVMSECRYCIKEGREEKECRLAKVLDRLGTELPDSKYGCKYQFAYKIFLE